MVDLCGPLSLPKTVFLGKNVDDLESVLNILSVCHGIVHDAAAARHIVGCQHPVRHTRQVERNHELLRQIGRVFFSGITVTLIYQEIVIGIITIEILSSPRLRLVRGS